MRLFFLMGLLNAAAWACGPSGSEKNQTADVRAAVQDSIARLFDPAEAARKAHRIDTFVQSMQRHGFNGTLLVAQYGRILYRKAVGYADFGRKDSLTTRSAFQLASVSKQFTAMAVMMLQERGRLRYEDSVQRFYPSFPYHGITIRQLLTHRSGLPNYTYFCDAHVTDRRTPISNQEVVSMLCRHQPKPYYTPNTRFDYSNTGYCLLAAIVEKVSGECFGDFLRTNIFQPLEMNNTLVYDKARNPVIPNRTVGYTAGRRRYDDTYLNGVVGDKGVYSTVEDLFRWETALHSEKLVKRATLEEAFVPAHKEARERNYGFGWRIHTPRDGDPVIFHGGWWQGYNAYLLHGRKDRSTIIMLSNVTNGSLHRIKELQEILHPLPAVGTALTSKKGKSG